MSRIGSAAISQDADRRSVRARGLSVWHIVSTLAIFSVLTAASESDAQESIAPVGEVTLVHDGFTFTEGPAWDPESETLYFSDIPNNTIFKLTSDGEVSTFTDDSKHTNGILVTRDGRLLGCQMDGQLVEYNKQDASAKPLAEKFAGRRFNAPNDLVMDASGGIFFTDPLFRAPTPLPQTVQSVYYVTAEGEVSRVTKDLPAPNGIGLSPEGDKLYVCPSRSAKMLVYEVRAEGGSRLQRPFVKSNSPPANRIQAPTGSCWMNRETSTSPLTLVCRSIRRKASNSESFSFPSSRQTSRLAARTGRQCT